MTDAVPIAISDVEMDAIVNVSLDRMNNLSHYAVMGTDPGPLNDDERLLFDSMVAEITASPGVAYHPASD